MKGKNYSAGKKGEQDSWEVIAAHGYLRPSAAQRKKIVEAFKTLGKEIKANGFDLIDAKYGKYIDNLPHLSEVVDEIILYEMKTAGKKRKTLLSENWGGFGFTLTGAEKHNADVLQEKYKFIFLNLKSDQMGIYALEDFYNGEKARIYPTWSIFIKGNVP